MYKNCVRQESILRQKRIVDRFVGLLRATPYREITVRQVCAAADISRTVFYRYFESKEDLIYALMDGLMLELLAEDGALPRFLDDHLESLGWFRFWHSRAQTLNAINQSGLGGFLTNAILDLVGRACLAPVQTRMTAAVFSLQEVRVRTAVCLMISMVSEWARAGLRHTPEDMAAFCDDFLHRPLLGDAER